VGTQPPLLSSGEWGKHLTTRHGSVTAHVPPRSWSLLNPASRAGGQGWP